MNIDYVFLYILVCAMCLFVAKLCISAYQNILKTLSKHPRNYIKSSASFYIVSHNFNNISSNITISFCAPIVLTLSLFVASLIHVGSYSFIDLLYSFFGAPCVLCVLFCLYFIISNITLHFKTIDSDAAHKHNTSLKYLKIVLSSPLTSSSTIILFVYGILLHLGTLGLLPFDISSLDLIYRLAFVGICIVFMSFFNKGASIYLSIALIIQITFTPSTYIQEAFTCGYLFVFLCFRVVVEIISWIKSSNNVQDKFQLKA